jgi:hypothetical protein
MSRKYNTKHLERGVSNYPARLSARGVRRSAVAMRDLDVLRNRQEWMAPLVSANLGRLDRNEPWVPIPLVRPDQIRTALSKTFECDDE